MQPRCAAPCLAFPTWHWGDSSALSTENALRSLLEALTCPPYPPTQHLEREQALAKQFAEILHFTLSFDELKVSPVGCRSHAVPIPGPTSAPVLIFCMMLKLGHGALPSQPCGSPWAH